MPGAEPFRSEGASGDGANPLGGRRNRVGIGFIHGFSGSPISMRPLAERLRDAGFRVDVPRLPGHGTHPKDMARTRYADWRAEVLRTVDRLAETSERVMLVGLSMGATLVLDVASSGERELARVVCINPQILNREGALVKLTPWLARVFPLAPAALAGLRKDDIAKPGVSEHAYDWVPTAAGHSFLEALPGIRARLGELRCDVLVAHSKQDHSVPPANSLELLKVLPHARELVLDRSYHVATLDYDLELLAARIAEFADELLGGAPSTRRSTVSDPV
jgi:carboxylesterase